MSSAVCTARNGSIRCARPLGHGGMHWSANKAARWGGRIPRADLQGKPGAVRDAARERAARLRRPAGERCRICCRDGQKLKDGACADRAGCEAALPPLFTTEECEAG